MQPKRKRLRLKKLLESSNGTFDDAAQTALTDLDAQEELTPVQHATRGNIIRYNILENPNAIPRAEPERRQFGRMVRDYAQAVHGLLPTFQITGMYTHNGRNGRNVPVGTPVGAHMHRDLRDWDMNGMRDLGDEPTILEAGNIIRGAMTLNDLFGPAMRDPFEQDFDIFQMMLLLNDTVQENGPVIQQNIVEQRVRNAAATAMGPTGVPTRAAVIEEVLKPTYTDDRQNVHDTKINNDLNEILRKISSSVSTDDEITSARSYISKIPDNTRRRRASEALTVMAEGGPMSTYKLNEAHIFALVWKRCSHPQNDESILREAVVDALADCFDGHPPHLVCANGRCSRVINSLALIDYDPSITGAMTFEAYKNLVMREAAEIFENAIADAEAGTDDERQVARSYTNPTVTANPEAERTFKDQLRDSVDRMLDNYSDKFNARELEQLRTECYTYVTL